MLSTSRVPTSPELAWVETFMCGTIPEGTMVDCKVPSSRSFCKLVSISFITLEGTHFTPVDAEYILLFTVFKDNICLAALPQIIHNSCSTDSVLSS